MLEAYEHVVCYIVLDRLVTFIYYCLYIFIFCIYILEIIRASRHLQGVGRSTVYRRVFLAGGPV